jgi:hypothetical protein
VKKLFFILSGLSLLGLIGLSQAVAPAGKTSPPGKAVPVNKSAPAGKSLPDQKDSPERQPAPTEGGGDPAKAPPGDSRRLEYFKTSLHHTGRGLAFWYGKEQKGLELLTRQPYEKLACKQCHIGSCQGCHQPVKKIKEPEGKPVPVNQETCLKCHDRLAGLRKRMRETRKEDVHTARGMTCMDCHTSREMHGDGQVYQSQKQPGAMDTRCDKCHEELTNSLSHRKHWKKVECQACHAQTVLNRTSTQFNLLAREGKRVTIPESDWIFLMSREGKLTAAGVESWVLPDGKTLMAFTPDGSHSVGKTGRKCGECHGSAWMVQARKGQVNLSWMEKGEIQRGKGLVPVLENAAYHLIQQQFQNGKWTPLENPGPATVQYAGFGGAITEKHFRKMLKFKSEERESKDKKKKK